jgi:hypothetical protein
MLPFRLDRGLAPLLVEYFEATRGRERAISWQNVRSANLADACVLLQACSQAAAAGVVTWTFTPLGDLDPAESRARAEFTLSKSDYHEARDIIQALHSRLGQHRLFPAQLHDDTRRLNQIARLSPVASLWIDNELRYFEKARLLGFLNRFRFLEAARDAGIVIDDDVFLAPFIRYARGADTTAHPLTPIAATTEVESLVEQLSQPTYLANVFSDDARARIIQGGALASIVARELGANVTDHAEAKRGWFCSRTIATGSGARRRRYIEVIVADDGSGLTQRLQRIADKDPRPAVRARWRACLAAGNVDSFLIDYAFDRFTSSRRSLHDLMHLPREERAVVSSGLFWIWTLTAAEHGILEVRTSTGGAVYDFRRPSMSRSHRRRDGVTSLAGTLIRVLLPLDTTTQAPTYRPTPKHLTQPIRTFGLATLPIVPASRPLIPNVKEHSESRS